MSETTSAKTFRWGILGAGHIAGKWASDLEHVPGATLQAVWARDPSKAGEFAKTHRSNRVATSVEDLLERGDLDAVYVATPHGRHHPDTLSCLDRGIPVLCEKAFALDRGQAGEMVQRARSRDVFLMEALWTRFLPGFRSALDVAKSGELGSIRSVQADFGFKAPYDPAKRLWDPAMGGGALLDIGLYPLFFALAFLGRIESLDVEADFAPNGVDQSIRFQSRHAGGGTSDLRATFLEATRCQAEITGTSGGLRFLPMFHIPTDVEVVSGNSTRTIPGKSPGHGYQFETSHVQECLASGWRESPLWSLEDTLGLMSSLDRIADRLSVLRSRV